MFHHRDGILRLFIQIINPRRTRWVVQLTFTKRNTIQRMTQITLIPDGPTTHKVITLGPGKIINIIKLDIRKK